MGNEMKTEDWKVIAAMLDLAGDSFSNKVCDDYDLDEPLPDVEDRRSLMQRYHEWNGDPEEFDPEDDYLIVSAASLMNFFASEAMKNVTGNKP